MDCITRDQAKELGLKRYYTGLPCKHGHFAERYVCNSQCCECVLERWKKGQEKESLRRRKRREANPAWERAYHAAYREKNHEQSLVKVRKWRAGNHKRIREYNREYHSNNPHVFRAIAAARRARKLQAQPGWSELAEIKRLFASRPEGFHIDHGIPLQHPLVCGLHVPCNLEAIPNAQNLAKSNHFDPDEWCYDPTSFQFYRVPLPTAPDYVHLVLDSL